MPERHDGAAATAGAICAAAMIANQVAGKAVRDALFLSLFPIERLPVMVIATAIVSIGAVIAMIRALARYGPARVVPIAFVASAALLLAEWGISRVSMGATAVSLYLHIGAIGSVLISGFWSLVNERFDPRTARRTIGRIAVGGTLGGLVGGALAMLAGPSVGASSLLLGLSALHLVCFALVLALRRRAPGATVHVDARAEAPGRGTVRRGARLLVSDPYLRAVAGLVLLATMSESLLDFVFKAEAAAYYGDGERLLRFFAAFYTGAGLLAFALQAALGRRVLERFGLLPALSAMPLSVAVVSAYALAVPGLVAVAIARGTEAVLRSSLHRSGYELLYVPVPTANKRGAKTLIDVAVDRLGDVLGGLAVVALLVVLPETARGALLAGSAGLALVALGIAVRLRKGYVSTLEASLVTRAVDLELAEMGGEENKSSVLLTLGDLDLAQVIRGTRDATDDDLLTRTDAHALVRDDSAGPPAVLEPLHATHPTGLANPTSDPVIAALVALRSGDPARANQTLRDLDPLPLELAPHVIALLAWDHFAVEAMRALRTVADDITGQLCDALLNPDEDFTIRRRVPRVLSATGSDRAVGGLVSGLADPEFEVRFQCGHALRRIVGRGDGTVRIDRDRIFDAVARDCDVAPAEAEQRQLIDELPDDAVAPFHEERAPAPARRTMQHVFILLSTVLPDEPLRIAHRGLYADDRTLRGTALEYLGSVLPAHVQRAIVALGRTPDGPGLERHH